MARIRITEDNCDAIMDERRDEEHLARVAERRVMCGQSCQRTASGPANDTPGVLVEIRAAEIAADSRIMMPSSAWNGWRDGSHNMDTPEDDEGAAGWLAWQICVGDEP